MLLELNQYLKEYEYLIKTAGTFLPFLVTFFMAIIAYQQWLINKRTETVSHFEKLREKILIPFEKSTEEFKNLLSADTSRESTIKDLLKYLNEIKQLLIDNQYLISNDNYDFIIISLKSFIQILEQHKKVKRMTFSFFILIYKLLASAINSYWAIRNLFAYNFNSNITIYGLIGNVIIKLYKFFIPYCLQIFLRNLFMPLILLIFLMFLFLKRLPKIIIKILKILINISYRKIKSILHKIYINMVKLSHD